MSEDKEKVESTGHWQLWDPKKYLREYYSASSISKDEIAVLRYLVSFLKKKNKIFDRALEFGTGPTIHHVIPLVPYVREIHLADYLIQNLQELKKWLNGKADAHDWNLHIERVLAYEGRKGEQFLLEREKLIRQRVTTVLLGDLNRTNPLGFIRKYPLVTSFYCADSATSTKKQWRIFMKNLFSLVAPAGIIIISALRKAKGYKVGDFYFKSSNIDEFDVERAFILNSINTATLDIRVVNVPKWRKEGFSSIIIASGEKKK